MLTHSRKLLLRALVAPRRNRRGQRKETVLVVQVCGRNGKWTRRRNASRRAPEVREDINPVPTNTPEWQTQEFHRTRRRTHQSDYVLTRWIKNKPIFDKKKQSLPYPLSSPSSPAPTISPLLIRASKCLPITNEIPSSIKLALLEKRSIEASEQQLSGGRCDFV